MAIISLMASKYKQVYGATAEVLGITLANMEEDNHVRLQCALAIHDHTQTSHLVMQRIDYCTVVSASTLTFSYFTLHY